MVSNASSTKKCPPNIRTGSVHPPVLVSPISVAHRSMMMEAEGAKKSSNWMRDQWVANLKKKRLAAAAAAAAGGLPVPPVVPVKPLSSTKTDGKAASEKRTTKSSNSRASRSKKNSQKDKDAQGKDTNGPTLVPPMLSTTEKDSLDLMHPAMFFHDLGSFEIDFSSVGTPTNFSSAEISRMWGPELDFPGGYVDTFLDLPTPKCADMPNVSSQEKKASIESTGDDLEQPKLVRTTSIEQEGLSQFLEQTTLESESPPSREASTPSSVRQSNGGLRRPTPTAGYSRQAQVAVDEYFGKMIPSPAPHRSQVLLAHGRLQATPRRGEYSFDSTSKSQQQQLPEFETLLDEYKFTDIDQELDSFYLDTIESFGGDIDLIPH
ncbi:hypothetical protein ATCC90586_001889 [Pythium insidiosum]|nr:hypothetical protein ATCC90586_001889 [Pythium insidiosum]